MLTAFVSLAELRKITLQSRTMKSRAYADGYSDALKDISEAIDALVPIEISTKPERWRGVKGGYQCNCGFVADYQYSFCPNCGAKMEV